MSDKLEDTREMLIQIREKMLHGDIEASAIQEIDKAILSLDEFIENHRDDKEAVLFTLRILGRVLRHLPSIEKLIESIFVS